MTPHPPLAGTHTAIVTPFKSDLSVDYDALARLIQQQLAAGIDGLIVLGTTGESPTITHDEFREIIRFCVEQAQGKTAIVAGVGSNDTQKTIDYGREAKELGANALLVVNPYYNKPTQEGLFRHFTAVADAVDLPQIVYNIKGRTGVNVETPTLMRLAAHRNIVAVKEASGDVGQMMDVIRQAPEGFTVLSGDDGLTAPLVALGGHGVISVLSNIIPGAVRSMVSAGLSGDYEGMRSQHYNLLPLMKGCFIETNPIPAKTALALLGMMEEVFRLPMCPMQEENKAKWKKLLQEHGIL